MGTKKYNKEVDMKYLFSVTCARPILQNHSSQITMDSTMTPRLELHIQVTRYCNSICFVNLYRYIEVK